MEREGGIVIDFVGFHDTYYDAFTYVTKQDSHYVTSSDHVDLNNRPPKTSAAIHTKQVAELARGVQPHRKNNKNQNSPKIMK